MIFGLDTTTSYGQAAVLDQDGKIHSITWSKESSHSDVVTQKIEKLFADNNLKISEIKTLCGFNGPGSFTGIRVCLSVLKTMAYNMSLPVYIESTLFGLALNSVGKVDHYGLSLMDAQRDKFFALHFNFQKTIDSLKKNFPVMLSPEELGKLLPPPNHVWSDRISHMKNLIPANINDGINIIHDNTKPALEEWIRVLNFSKNNFKSYLWNEIEPLYLRASSAEEKLVSTKV